MPGRRQSATFCKKMNMTSFAPKRVSELLFTIGVHCRGIYDVDTEIDCQANQPIDGLVMRIFRSRFRLRQIRAGQLAYRSDQRAAARRTAAWKALRLGMRWSSSPPQKPGDGCERTGLTVLLETNPA